MEAAAFARLSRRALPPSSARHLSAAAAAAVEPSSDRVKWDYRGQPWVIPLGQWVPKIAVDAYVAPSAVLAGQVTIGDGNSVWNGAVLRDALNKITVGFSSNVQERCVLHASRSSPTGQIGYALVPMIARGLMLGPEQPVILHMIDILPAAETLNGEKMELVDAAFPLLKDMVKNMLPRVYGNTLRRRRILRRLTKLLDRLI